MLMFIIRPPGGPMFLPLQPNHAQLHANSPIQSERYDAKFFTTNTTLYPHQTPIWNQPEPAPPAPDNADADIGDNDDEAKLTIHEQEHHELCWPQETRLIHPARGRWSLWVQNNSVKAVVQDAFPLAQRYVASINAFPYL